MSSFKKDTVFAQKYNLLNHIDTGAFADVWEARYAVTNETVALKIFPRLDQQASEEIKSDWNPSLKHEYLLIPTHVDRSEEGYLFYVMPYCGGGNAAKLIGEMNEDMAAAFVAQTASALEYLHQKEIMHSDIKPNNFLIDDRGNYYLADLGLSRRTRNTIRMTMAGSANRSISSSEAPGMTPISYRAPELYEQDKADQFPVKATDVWSYGASLYELLSGDLPFGDFGGLMLHKDGNTPPNLPSQFSDDLNMIIRCCLLRDPWDRPPAQKLREWANNYLSSPAHQRRWLTDEDRNWILNKLAQPAPQWEYTPPPPSAPPASAPPTYMPETPISGSGGRNKTVMLAALILVLLLSGSYMIYSFWGGDSESKAQPFVDAGKEYLGKGECDNAAKEFNKALELEAENADAKTGLDDANKCVTEQRVSNFIKQGKEAMNSEKWKDAIAAFDQALALDASNKEASTQKSLAESKMNQPTEEPTGTASQGSGDIGSTPLPKPQPPQPPSPTAKKWRERSPDKSQPTVERIEVTQSRTLIRLHMPYRENAGIFVFPVGHKQAFRMRAGGEFVKLRNVIGSSAESIEVPIGGYSFTLIFDGIDDSRIDEFEIRDGVGGTGGWHYKFYLR